MAGRRVLMRGAAVALSVAALVGLRRTVAPTVPATAMAAPAHTLPQLPQPGQPRHWSVVVDGWRIEVDQVVAQHAVARDPEIAAEASAPSLLSQYDQIIGRYADEVGLDWRFVAAIIYEESRFQPDSVSDAGAYGLMQVRAVAAREVGEMSFREPEANIRTGVHYLQRLQREYAGAAHDRDRHALMLAAYNMGLAHVQDAQALAQRFGYDPLRWDGAMDVMVSLLEEPNVYSRLPGGFAQGRSVVDYVDRVLRRYAAYRQTFPAAPPGGVPPRAIAAR